MIKNLDIREVTKTPFDAIVAFLGLPFQAVCSRGGIIFSPSAVKKHVKRFS